MAGFDWTDLITPGVGLAGSLIGNNINAGPAKASVKENARQFDVRTQRSDQARAMLVPYLQQSLGAGGGMSPSLGATGYMPSSYPAYGEGSGGRGGLGSTLKKVGGIAGSIALSNPKLLAKGASALGGLLSGGGGTKMAIDGTTYGSGAGGLGSGMSSIMKTAGPVALGLAYGAGMQKLLGKVFDPAHNQANKLTGPQGIQRNLNDALTELSQRGLPPEQFDAAAAKMMDIAARKAMVFASQDANHKKVVQQMLGSYNWNPAMAQVANRYLGSLA